MAFREGGMSSVAHWSHYLCSLVIILSGHAIALNFVENHSFALEPSDRQPAPGGRTSLGGAAGGAPSEGHRV